MIDLKDKVYFPEDPRPFTGMFSWVDVPLSFETVHGTPGVLVEGDVETLFTLLVNALPKEVVAALAVHTEGNKRQFTRLGLKLITGKMPL